MLTIFTIQWLTDMRKNSRKLRLIISLFRPKKLSLEFALEFQKQNQKEMNLWVERLCSGGRVRP